MPDQETTRLDRLGTTELEPGWTEGLDMARYLGDGAVSASILWKLHQETPSHLAEELRNGTDESTPAKDTGHLVHTLVYEEDEFEGRYVVIGECEARTNAGEKCTNAGKYWRGGRSFCGVKGHDPEKGAPMADGIYPVAASLTKKARAMKERLFGEPEIRMVLTAPGPREVTGVWQDEKTGLWCRIRPDQLIHEPPTLHIDFQRSVVNLKSTGQLAGPKTYVPQAERMGYHFKAAFYRMGMEELSWWPQNFLYPVVEQSPPYEPILYRLNDDALDAEELHVRETLSRLAVCVKEGRWPGWGSGKVHDLPLKEWRMRQIREAQMLGVG